MEQNVDSLLSDAPLSDPEHDLLGRKSFAEALAKSILTIRADQGFTYALYGPWGSGKTTALNFVLHYVNALSSPENMPIVVHFNPWWFSGQEQLILQFFSQLRVALEKPDVPDQLKKLGSRLQTFARALTPLSYIPIAKDWLDPIRNIFQSYGEAVETAGKHREKDVFGLRQEIDQVLKSQDRRFLIVIDDLDRLTWDEIRQMFRVIKAVADFPKTIYLLAFDRQVVVSALESFQGISGEGYLEKIVQSGFDLPLPDKPALRRLLFAHLDILLSQTPAELWDETHWGNVFWDGIDVFIETPRDVKRLVNSLLPSYSAVQGEVNFADFVALESLRVFVSSIYSVVRSNPDLFAGAEDQWASSRDPRAARRSIYEEYLKSVEPKTVRDAAHAILQRLFPKYASAFGASIYGPEWERDWQRGLRICSSTVFPVYFRLDVTGDSVSASELRALISHMNNRTAFSDELIRLSQQKQLGTGTSRVRSVLERLEAYTEKGIPKENIQSAIEGLFDAGDAILEADDRTGMLDSRNHLRILRLTHQVLGRIETQEKRFDMLSHLVESSRSLTMLAHLVISLGYEHGKYESKQIQAEEERTVNATQLQTLENQILKRIEAAAEDNSLFHSPELSYMLFAWRNLRGSDDAPKQYVGNLVKSDEGIAKLLVGFLQQGFQHTITDRVEKMKWGMHIPSIQKFVDTENLKGQCKKLLETNPAWLTDRQRLAIAIFLRDVDKPPRENIFEDD